MTNKRGLSNASKKVKWDKKKSVISNANVAIKCFQVHFSNNKWLNEWVTEGKLEPEQVER